MKGKRSTLLIAAGLVLVTAVVAAMAPGSPRDGAGSSGGATSFESNRSGPLSFKGSLDRTAVLQGRDGMVRMELVITPERVPDAVAVRRATDLVVVLDRSGSMDGEKMRFAKQSIAELVGQLGSEDRFSLVSYASDARLDLALLPVANGYRAEIREALARVGSNGGTNMSAGIDRALAVIESDRSPERVPRVVLISDGLANEGDPSPSGLISRASRAARGEYMLSTIGVGADFNEDLMISLANAGSGNYYYLENTESLAYVLSREFDHARTTVASGLKIEIEPASGVRVLEAAGYPLENEGKAVVVRPGAVFAGNERRIWVTMAVPNSEPGEFDLGRFSLSYTSAGDRHTLRFADAPRLACVADEKHFLSSFDKEAWGRAVMIDGYGKMRQEVAREVKAGRRDAAVKKLNEFRDQVDERASLLGYAPAQEKMKDVDKLEAAVQSAFEGDDQKRLQNELSKSESDVANRLRALGYEGY